MSSGGGWSVAVFHLLRLASRVLILLLIGALGFVFFLTKRFDSAAFQSDLSHRFSKGVAASEAQIAGFKREQGRARIRRIGAEGTSASFFQTLEAGNLNFKMTFLNGLSGDWDVGIIEGNWIDVQVKAGANSPEEAAAAAETLFKRRRNFDVLGLDFSKARVTWGYDKRVGEIEGSKMSAHRVSEGWRFNFRGGRFTQNWIRDFEIEEMVMLCTPNELIVEKGVLVADDGRIDFKDVKIKGGELPQISGRLILKNIPIESLLPEKILERIDGSISAELEFGGSTNSAEGLSLQGPVTLGEGDSIQIRDEIPILKALDVVDVFNSYKRVPFTRGGFNLKTGGGEMLISGLNLETRDQVSLQGRLSVSYPTDNEAARTIGENSVDMIRPMTDDREERQAKKDITLRRAADESKVEENAVENSEFFAGLASKRDAESLRRAAAMRARNTLNFDGGFRMTIPGDAFERSRILRERYPIDQATSRIGIDIPLRGTLSELTLSQAEAILRDGGSND